jgi:hypothetical protein
VVPCFRCSFLLDMSSSTTPESPSATYAQFLHRRHWPSTISHGFGTLDSPTIHFRWVHLFGATSSSLLQPVELFASFGGPARALAQPTETSTSGLPTGRSPLPSPDMTTVATGQVPPAGFPPAGMAASIAAREIRWPPSGGCQIHGVPCGLQVVRTDCPPSPCARFSRVRTITEAPPPDRDNAGLGGLPYFATRGARLGVPLFNGDTLDALGGQLYPSPHGPTPESGFRRRRTRSGGTQSIRQDNRVLAANTPESVVRFLQRLPSLTSTCAVVRAWLHHGICGRPTGSGPLRPFGSCRPSIRSWTTFAAPFYARPDRARMASYGSIGFSFYFQGALSITACK